MDFSRLRIAVVGDAILDHYIWGKVERISPEAPVPVVHVQRDSWVLGGAANVAANLAALGVQAELVGPSGDDEAGRTLDRLLGERGITYEAQWRGPGRPTIIKSRVIVERQQLCRLDREDAGPAYAVDPAAGSTWLERRLPQLDAIILSDYAKGALSQPFVDAVLRAARAAGVLVAVDPKPRKQLHFARPSVMTPNRLEAFELAGITDAGTEASVAEAARRILERFDPDALVVTLGPDGMLICPREGDFTPIPTVAREVFDVSGAGDTVIATLTAGLAARLPLEEAVQLSNHAAGIVVGKVGTAVVSRDELWNQPSSRV